MEPSYDGDLVERALAAFVTDVSYAMAVARAAVNISRKRSGKSALLETRRVRTAAEAS
jgi:hypothetical protein